MIAMELFRFDYCELITKAEAQISKNPLQLVTKPSKQLFFIPPNKLKIEPIGVTGIFGLPFLYTRKMILQIIHSYLNLETESVYSFL